MAVVVGTNNNDTLSGTASVDTLQGGLGNDTLKGGVGSDVYLFNQGDGADLIDDYNGSGIAENNVVRLGVDFSFNDLRISNEAGHMVIRFANSASDSITVRYHFYGDSRWLVSGIELNDGSLIDIRLSSTAYTLYSSTTDAGGTVDSNYMGVDIITGANGNDIFYSHAGNDSLWSADGDDKLYGEDGDDNLDAGSGNDTLRGGNNNDWLSGGDGVDDLDGQNGDDTLIGGLGADTVKGGVGSDTYIFNIGDGADYIEDYNNSGVAETNIIQLGAGVTLQNLRLSIEGNQHLVIRFSNSPQDSITLAYHYYFDAERHISKVSFADNSYLDISQNSTAYILYSQATETGGTINSDYIGNDSMIGATADDTFYSNAGNDTLIGGGGNDRLHGEDGNDNLKGGTGNDTLKGGAGNDILNGETGDDYLEGGEGNDTYYVDSINDQISDSAGIDTVYVNADNYRATGIENIIYQQDTLKLAYFIEALQSGSSWSNTLSTAITVNFSFAESSDLTGFRTYTEAEKTLARSILDEYAQVSGLTFSEVSDSDAVQIRFFIDDTPSEGGSSGYAYYPKHGDIHMDNSYSTSYHVYIHEIGHALGLKHSFDAEDADEIALPTSEDNTINTNMSYTGSWSYRGLRMYDLAAIHYLYGVNHNQRISNDTYTQADKYIWDGVGIDSLSVASATQSAYIDLRDGAWSYIGAKADSILADNQFFIGVDTQIENAIGGLANDILRGNELANLLTGGLGNDILNGAEGQDTAAYGGMWSQYKITGTVENATIVGLEGTDSLLNIEFLNFNGFIVSLLDALTINIITGTTGNDNLVGTTGNDSIVGFAGNDTLNGGIGVDTLVGGLGNDTYHLTSDIGDSVVELANEGTDTVVSTFSYSMAANIEYLTLTGSAAIDGTGNELNNVIVGNSANNVLIGGLGLDVLSGGLGLDTLVGGLGNDAYHLTSDIGDSVVELANEGTDTVISTYSYNMAANIEYLTLTGSAAIDGTGNELNNVIVGNSANNVLTGGLGNDALNGGLGLDNLVGGLGNDTYHLTSDIGDKVIELANEGIDTVLNINSYSLASMAANVENLTLTGSANNNGTGNELNNMIIGNIGNNILTGGLGLDTLVGGLGNDTYHLTSDIGDSVVELANEGTDTVISTYSYNMAANIEYLTLTGSAAIDGTGNELNNVIVGNSANNVLTGGLGLDVLSGGLGLDTLVGGLGNDTYHLTSDIGDSVVELANEGTDTVISTYSYNMAANIEYLTLTGSAAIDGTGNELNNVIVGNSANNVLTGGLGNDALNGGLGLDNLVGGLGNDTYHLTSDAGDSVVELVNEGTDTVISTYSYNMAANIENLTLSGNVAIDGTGNELNNVIVGNSANNVLTGGLGDDSLNGGLGNDSYILARGYGIDTVTDVDSAVGNIDVLNWLSGVSHEQLWFKKVVNDLEVSIIGTSDKATLKGWYSGTNNQIEQFKTMDGNKTLLNSQVQNLVTAMASVAAPSMNTTTLDSTSYSSVLAVINGNWS